MNQENNSNSDSSAEKARKIGMLTDVGQVRTVDEDSILAADLSFGVNSESSKFLLLAVADGMGGHAKGEEASKIALNAIARAVIPDLLNNTPFTKILEKGIQNANQDILDYTAKNPEASGMGTTSVCAVVKDNQIHLANVGDSRAYRVSDDEICRVTKDHSYVQALIDEGEITEEQAREHPRKNEITRAVGIMPSIEVDTMKLTLDSDESLLLCCDGVIAHLSDDDIHKIIRDSPDPQTACQEIVDMANERGGSDNISLIILSSEGSDTKETEPDPTSD
ncbi:MAG TPA: Stp1/IreP family PP2C-type Ser/Thr phosphatase [Candidatus Nitrosopelagicus sp.]|nr:Stp1/IreP family PP2C-type Ser/Thr phosphatase [Candidatus Nitrosopelagicus sp.]